MNKKTDPHSTHREVELMESLRAQGGSARTARLAETLGVSEETIRRTVKALAKSGRVQRVHGGVYLTNTEAMSPVVSRLGKRSAEKLMIARAAAQLIPNGTSLFLDVGSTSAFVAECLKDHLELTVITNGIHAAQSLANHNGNRVFLAGGELRSLEGGTFGQDTLDFVQRFNIDTAIFSTDGFDPLTGFLLAAATEADLARSVSARARRNIVVCDHAKFGQSAPIVAFAPESVDVVVTDKAPKDPFKTQLHLWEIEVVVAQ